MTAGSLTSNHVNYLIWRYLQESGHGEAAVKLQRDWNSDPQSLPFAPHIRTHALVSLVQKGLQYHEIEQTISQARHQMITIKSSDVVLTRKQNGDRVSPSPSMYFFGPESFRSIASPNGEEMDEDDVACASRSSPRSRKHARDSGSNGIVIDPASQAPAPKRHRRSNGIVVENSSNGDGHGSGDAMEIDRNGYSHPEPESPTKPDAPTAADSPTTAAAAVDVGTPQEHAQTYAQAYAQVPAQVPAQAQATVTLTNGNSVGVQSEKIAELGPETSVLDVGLADRKCVMHTAWHPKEPAVLATAGEALARIWNILRSDSPKQHVDLLEPGDRSLVTALSWSPDGEYLAVATRNMESGWMGEVTIWTKAGVMRDVLPAAQDMMLALRWNSSGSLLLGVASSGKASGIVIWDPSTGQALQPLELESTVVDAAWTGNSQFFVCGEDTIIRFNINDDHTISAIYNYTTQEIRRNWSMISFDPVSVTIAVAAEETACLGIIDSTFNIRTTITHTDPLTALSYQPHPNPSTHSPTDPRLLATASLDGTLKIWDAKRPFVILHKLSLGRDTPAMALSFTPDGYLVAAASYSKILIWRADEGGLPKACWIGEKARWLGGDALSKVDRKEEKEEEKVEDHSLSWDADGGKLAFGLGRQIAIINFRR